MALCGVRGSEVGSLMMYTDHLATREICLNQSRGQIIGRGRRLRRSRSEASTNIC